MTRRQRKSLRNRKLQLTKAKKKLQKEKNRFYKHQLTRHHRIPISKGGTDESIVLVPRFLHEAWHLLFVNYTPETIAQMISEVWLDPRFELICRRKE